MPSISMPISIGETARMNANTQGNEKRKKKGAKMNDLISRQAAKEVVCEICGWSETSLCDECKHPIDELPTINPVKHGKWVHDNPLTDTLVCTECNYSIPTDELKTPYCPWCGARMDGE